MKQREFEFEIELIFSLFAWLYMEQFMVMVNRVLTTLLITFICTYVHVAVPVDVHLRKHTCTYVRASTC